LANTPFWDSPQFRRIDNEYDTQEIADLLEKHQLRHLKVYGRGRHLVVYDEYQGEKMPRVRFTRISSSQYQLDIANHRGKWEFSPFTGSISELFDTLIRDLSWVLAEI
jgi:hypothetical protein